MKNGSCPEWRSKKVNKRLAIASLVFAISSLLLASTLSVTCGLDRLIRNIVVCSTVGLSMVFAMLISIPLRFSGKWNRYQWTVFTAILVSCFTLIEGVYAPWRNNYYVDSICRFHMANIGKAIENYAEENDGQFPSARQWCDILMNNTRVREKDFICPISFWPVFSYGFNKTLDGLTIEQIDPNTVLIFEIEGGRNVTGGPEIMDIDKHAVLHEKGSFVLFVDGHGEFVRKENVKNLNWSGE